MMPQRLLAARWSPERPRVLVIACSDGRLQECLDEYLNSLSLRQYDRLYAPGGGGALVATGFDHVRAGLFVKECQFLVTQHQVREVFVAFHGPPAGGEEIAVCADYRRKMPYAGIDEIRRQQETDAAEIRRIDWGGDVTIHIIRLEVQPDHSVQVVEIP